MTCRKVCAQSLERIFTTALWPPSNRPTLHTMYRQEMLVQFWGEKKKRKWGKGRTIKPLRTTNDHLVLFLERMFMYARLTKVLPLLLSAAEVERLWRCGGALAFLKNPNNSGVSWREEIWGIKWDTCQHWLPLPENGTWWSKEKKGK